MFEFTVSLLAPEDPKIEIVAVLWLTGSRVILYHFELLWY
jgi:hypothetical protein